MFEGIILSTIYSDITPTVTVSVMPLNVIALVQPRVPRLRAKPDLISVL